MTSETIPSTQLNIHQRILNIMDDLDYIQKGDAKVNGQYRFVSHDQVAAKVHKLLVKHRVTIIPSIKSCVQNNNRTEMILLMHFINADNPADQFTTEWPGYGIDASDKGPGKASSYAYKVALLKTFCLETGDDPDNDASAVYEPAKCLEFESILPDGLSDKDKTKLNKFLAHSAASLQKHVEDVKREAVKRPQDFLNSFNKWNPKKVTND